MCRCLLRSIPCKIAICRSSLATPVLPMCSSPAGWILKFANGQYHITYVQREHGGVRVLFPAVLASKHGFTCFDYLLTITDSIGGCLGRVARCRILYTSIGRCWSVKLVLPVCGCLVGHIPEYNLLVLLLVAASMLPIVGGSIHFGRRPRVSV